MEEPPPIAEETTTPLEEKIEDKKEEPDEDKSESQVVETPEVPDFSDPKEFLEPKEPPEAKSIDSNLQISKLKCQIMSKLSDDEPESSKVTKKSSHRTPRSKILESYRNDKSKEKQRRSVEEKEETAEELKKEHHAPKKSKFLKFAQEENDNEDEAMKEETKSDIIKEVEAIPEKNPDEEIGKINQIDQYLNDFLFDFPKKAETPPKEIEETKIEEEKVDKPSNELHIKCVTSTDDQESEVVDISIKTNLTNFNKSEEEMSALSTLAMVSQLETAQPDDKIEETVKPPFEPKPEPELVPIDGNLTVVSEKDLADGQVEITASASPIYKKPVTLTNFSMDFSECNSNSTNDSVTSELEEKPKEETKKIPGPEDVFDLEEHIPSQIVDKAKPTPLSHSSKLLERLTEPKPKDNSTPKSLKVPTKDSTKVAKTKFVIKPPQKAAKPPPPQSNKPIILSEKIIKPVKGAGDSSGSVSVQKITSKRNLHDPDEIDAFIIQKGAKNVDEEDEEHEELAEIPAKKSRKNTSGMDPKKLQVSSTATSVKKRGKAKILQQTIITPAGEIIQPNVAAAAAAAVVSQDDNVFDINSMPIVLSDQILTPESIENMPIYLSESTPEPITPTTKIQTTIVKKTPVTVQNQQVRLLNKSIASPVPKLVKTPKILGSVGSKLVKHNSFSPGAGKHGKYVIVTQAGTTPTSRYTVGKKQTIIKRVAGDLGVTSAGTLTKVQNIAPEPSGNKIMILTDQQGQQQRVLLTPAQQKMMGYQGQGGKVAKTVVKGE